MRFDNVLGGAKRPVGWLCGLIVLTGLLLPPVVPTAQAAPGAQTEILPGLTFGGSLRLRYENKENFKFGASAPGDSQDYLLSQLRLNLTWTPADHIKVFLQAQDSRVHSAFRDNVINDKKAPNIFADEFDLHQGYVDVKIAPGGKQTTVRIGRQKFNMGALRLIASLEWVNTARVWDGIRTTTKLGDGKSIDLIASRLVPVRPEGFNSHANTGSRMFNSRFHAIYYTDTAFHDDSRLEGYLLLRETQSFGDEVYTAGTRFAHKGKKWDLDGELAQQFGTYGGLTQRATMLHLGGGYAFSAKTHLGAAYNYGSGDSDPNDGTHETFDNQFPLNHAYYGYMDFFALQNVHNLELVLKHKLAKKVSTRLAFQHFILVEEDSDAWYNAGAGKVRTATSDVDPTVGSEIDLTVKVVMVPKKLVTVVGYSHFFTGQYVTDTAGPDEDADFVFLQSKWTF